MIVIQESRVTTLNVKQKWGTTANVKTDTFSLFVNLSLIGKFWNAMLLVGKNKGMINSRRHSRVKNILKKAKRAWQWNTIPKTLWILPKKILSLFKKLKEFYKMWFTTKTQRVSLISTKERELSLQDMFMNTSS